MIPRIGQSISEYRPAKYHFKYLLYECPSIQFTEAEARRLARSETDFDALTSDLEHRSTGYLGKVLSSLRRYPRILEAQIKAVEDLEVAVRAAKRARRTANPAKREAPIPSARRRTSEYRKAKNHFRYLLYECPSMRFTEVEARRLARSENDFGALTFTLQLRGGAYFTKVLNNLRRYPNILEARIKAVTDLEAVAARAAKSGIRQAKESPMSVFSLISNQRTPRSVQGGAPGLGKKA